MTGCFGTWCLAWYAAHDVFSQASTSSLRTLHQYLVSTQVCVIVQYLSPLAHLSPLASTKRQIMVHIQ